MNQLTLPMQVEQTNDNYLSKLAEFEKESKTKVNLFLVKASDGLHYVFSSTRKQLALWKLEIVKATDNVN